MLEKELKKLISENKVIPFVGAGVSMAIRDNEDNKVFPSWHRLLENFIPHIEKTTTQTVINALLEDKPVDYLEVADKIEQALTTNDFNKYLKASIDVDYNIIDERTYALAKAVWNLGSKLVITTNYDKVLHQACEDKNIGFWDIESLHEQGNFLRDNTAYSTVWNLHGHVDNVDNIILTTQKYKELYTENVTDSKYKASLQTLQTVVSTHSLLFIGFSLDDAFVVNQLNKIIKIFGGNTHEHYVLVKKGSAVNTLNEHIRVIEYEEHGQQLIDKINTLSQENSSNTNLHIINTKEETNPSDTDFIKPFNVPFEAKKEGAIGIEKKLQEVHEALLTTKRTNIGQVASFQGMGGLGKTQLAVEYAHTYKDSYDGIVWLTIDQDIDEQLIELAEKSKWVNKEVDINVKLSKAQEGYAALENTLLIYDNVENVEEIEPLFPKSSTNHILVTSRSPIQKFTSIPLDTLNEENSIKLLESESQRKIKDDELPDVKMLVTKLEGLPLALEMAGAYVSFLECSWQEYWKLFSTKGISFLEKSEIRSYTNHETNIGKTLSLGDKLLKKTPKLEEILNVLTWGALDAIDENLLSRMLGEDKVELIEPIRIGLKLKFVKKSEDGYTLHRLVRDIWRDQKTLDNSFAISISQKLASYMKEIKDEFLYLRELDRAATQAKEWAVQIGDLHTKAALINYSVYANYHKGEHENALKEINNILKLFDENECTAIYAELLNSKGVFLSNSGDDQEAHKLYMKSFEIKQAVYGDINHEDIAQSLHNLAASYLRLGDRMECKKYIANALEMRRQLYIGKNHYKISESLNMFSNIERRIGSMNKAKIYATESLKMIKELYPNIDHPGIAYAFDALSSVLSTPDDVKIALDYANESLDMRMRLYSNTNHRDIALGLNTLGSIYNLLKKHKYALNYYMESLQMRKIVTPDNHTEIAITLRNMAINFLHMKDCQNAKQYIEESFVELRKLDYPFRDILLYTNTLKDIDKNIKNYINANYKKKSRYCIDI